MSAPALEIRGLETRIGATPVHHGVDVTVGAGEAVTVLGSNGAGKTTLLRAVMGLLRPTRGAILVDGVDITAARVHERAGLGIAYVPEGRRIFADLTVRENLGVGGHARRRSAADEDRRVAEIFAVFPALADKARQLGGELSGGQQQMLAIGRALMADPRVLLLDEPSLGLAPMLVADVRDVLLDIRRRSGTAILIVEQNAGLAFAVAERAYLMARGEIVASGSASELEGSDLVRELYLGASHRPTTQENAP